MDQTQGYGTHRLEQTNDDIDGEQPEQNELWLEVTPDDGRRANSKQNEQQCSDVQAQVFERAEFEIGHHEPAQHNGNYRQDDCIPRHRPRDLPITPL
jgi:hypothetical protein